MVHDSSKKNKEKTGTNGMCVASWCLHVFVQTIIKKFYILKHARIQHIHSKMAYTQSERVKVCTSNIIIGTEPEAKRNKTQNTTQIRKMALHPCLKRQTRTKNSILITKYKSTCVFCSNVFYVFWTHFLPFHPSYEIFFSVWGVLFLFIY